MRDELVELNRAVVCIFQREQSLPRIFQLFGEVDAEQFLVALQSLRAMEAIPDVVEMPVHVQHAAFRQSLVQCTVRTVAIRLNDGIRRLVREQHVAEDHRITREVKPVFHPPRYGVIAVVIAAHQNFAARPLLNHPQPIDVLADANITEVDEQIFRFNRAQYVAVYALREIWRALAIRVHVVMLEMRVADKIYVHVLALLYVIVVPISNSHRPFCWVKMIPHYADAFSSFLLFGGRLRCLRDKIFLRGMFRHRESPNLLLSLMTTYAHKNDSEHRHPVHRKLFDG